MPGGGYEMKSGPDVIEDMDQYDYIDTEYLEKHKRAYSSLIGSFLIDFSLLEHEIDIAIADFVFDDAHEPGFLILSRLKTSDKVELFSGMYAGLSAVAGPRFSGPLKKVKMRLKSATEFRNKLVHACWGTLSKGGLVRTKSTVDDRDGRVKFKKARISPAVIRSWDTEVKTLADDLGAYCDHVHESV
jgi:hypothetical protein